MSKKLTKEEFVKRSDNAHNGKYDYSLVEYKNTNSKVKIKCPVHGVFEQTPSIHMRKGGCPACKFDKLSKLYSLDTETFIKKAIIVHGDRYDYSLVNYKNAQTKVKIICPEHGVFEQRAVQHYKGKGCRKCKGHGRTTDDFIKLSEKLHNYKYDYSLTTYSKAREKVKIICPEHGVFKQTADNHLSGNGCKKCAMSYVTNIKLKGMSFFIKNATEIHHNKYDYSLVKFSKLKEKVKIICPEHGVFKQTPDKHLRGQGCPKCASNYKLDGFTFVSRAKEIHGDKYDYSRSVYVNVATKVEIICPKHGSFWQIPNNHLSRLTGCPKCINPVSKPEQELFDFLSGYVTCEQSNRELLKPSEIDIFIPSLNIAVEYNGLYWHSDKIVGANYHLDKLNNCNNKGVRLIHLFDDEWRNKKEICKSRLLNLIGKTPNRIYARKCEIRKVDSKTANKFLDKNHIQGKLGSKVKLGLYYNNELVSLMTFGSLRKNMGQTAKEGSYELLRFCNKLNTNVVGGASRLLRYFEKIYRPKEIISYADRRWSNGNLYKQLGFEHVSDSQPNYFYTKGEVRENRFKYRKSELVKQGFDPNKTERQIMEDLGYSRVYDCGTMKFYKSYL